MLKTYSKCNQINHMQCRFCLNKIACGLNIFSSNFNHLNLLQQLQIPIEDDDNDDDDLPGTICKSCNEFIEQIQLFINKCKSNIELIKKEHLRKSVVLINEENLLKDICTAWDSENDVDDVIPQNEVQKILTGPSFKCTHCSKIFSNNSSLKRHVNIHLGFKQHICSFCKKSFSQACVLNRHLFTHKLGELPYTCAFCNKGFIQKINLKVHIFVKHLKLKTQFKCQKCEKVFSYQSGLSRHITEHNRMIDNVSVKQSSM